MGNYNFDTRIERRGSGCIKWDRSEEPDILPLWIADMDFAVAPEIKEALQARVAHGVFGYPKAPDDFYEPVCDWMERRFGYRPEREWFSHSPGIVAFFHFFCKGFLKPGDKVLMQMPVYHHFFGAAEKNSVEVVKNQLLIKNGRYEIDFSDFENKAKDPGVKAFFLCNPHNPGGRMWSREELQRLGRICCENNILIISDEIHCDLVYKYHGKRHIPLASVSQEIAMNSITCLAPSKTFNLAGLQTSIPLIPNPVLKARYEQMLDSFGIFRPNLFGLTALPAAYRYGEPWLEELLEYLEGNLRYLRSWMSEHLPMVKVMEPDASYLVWMDFSAIKPAGRTVHDVLLEEGWVWLEEGCEFGDGGEAFERVNIACPRATLAEGLARIQRGLEKADLIKKEEAR